VDLADYLPYLRMGLSWLYPLLVFAAALVCWRHRTLAARMPLLIAGLSIAFFAEVLLVLAPFGPRAEPPLQGQALRIAVAAVLGCRCLGWGLVIAGLAAVFASLKERLADASSLQPIKSGPRTPPKAGPRNSVSGSAQERPGELQS
jgi:hypothetical protein